MTATAEDLAKVDAMIAGKPADPPERIHNWTGTHFSIARFAGGLTYQGHRYVIAYHERGQPLVRWDVVLREAQAKREQDRAAQEAARAKQGDLL